jgi:hypothetical protein
MQTLYIKMYLKLESVNSMTITTEKQYVIIEAYVRDNLISKGWKNSGTAFYGLAN